MESRFPESELNPRGIGIGTEDMILCLNQNRNWNLTTVSGIQLESKVPESSYHWYTRAQK